jgi:isoprenylcysteine carboxyl methyltransferase (ICMT) family protein YpbQ
MCSRLLYINYIFPGMGSVLHGDDDIRVFAIIHMFVFLLGLHILNRNKKTGNRWVNAVGLALIFCAVILSAEQTCNIKRHNLTR